MIPSLIHVKTQSERIFLAAPVQHNPENQTNAQHAFVAVLTVTDPDVRLCHEMVLCVCLNVWTLEMTDSKIKKKQKNTFGHMLAEICIEVLQPKVFIKLL